MLKRKLDELAFAALDWLMCQLALLWDLARHNPRMTAKGAVAAAVYLAAHFGLEISPASQILLGSALIAYLGVAGRDRPRGEFR